MSNKIILPIALSTDAGSPGEPVKKDGALFEVAHALSYSLLKLDSPSQESTMNTFHSVIAQLQNVMDVLAGVRPFQPLPAAFFDQPDWHKATQGLQLPAVWRRGARHQ